MTRRRLGISFIVIVLVLLVAALVITPPRALVRQIAIASAAPLMSGSNPEDGRFSRIGKRVLGSYVQMAIATHLAETIPTKGRSDEEILYDMMRVVRAKTLNQLQFSHAPRTWPTLLSGAGYCDQVNASVCMLAATHFPKTEIFALHNEASRTSPHTIGRVWSEQRKTWLYFDAFWSEPAIFEDGPDHHPVFAKLDPPQFIASRGTRPEGLYEMSGAALAGFPRTFGQFLIARAFGDGGAYAVTAENTFDARTDDGRSLDPEPATETATAVASTPVVTPASGDGDDAYRTMARQFVAARMDHLFGRSPVQHYRELAAERPPHADARSLYISSLAKSLAKASADVQR